MKIRVLAIGALALFLPFAAVACGDDSTGDLSIDEISEEMQKSGLPEDQADCVAKALKEADFTEDDLNDLATDPDSEKGKAYIEAATKCLGSEIPTTTAAP